MIKVMIVDDEPPFIRSITRQIAHFSNEFEVVSFAYNGKDALEKLAAAEIDVLITDIKMPVMDGIELLKTVFELYPNIQTMIVSGYQDFEYAKAALKIGVMDYLLKPVEKTQFAEAMKKIHEKLKKKFNSLEIAILNNALLGQQVDEMQRKRHFNANSYRAMLILNGVYAYTSNLGPSKRDSSFMHMLNHSLMRLQKPIKWWTLNIRPEKLYLIVFAYENVTDGDGAVDACEACEAFYRALEHTTSAINAAVSPLFPNIQMLHAVAEKLEKSLKNKAVLGQSNLFTPGEFSRANLSSPTPFDGMMISKLDVLIQSQSRDLLLRELQKITEAWELERATQIVVERSIRQLLQLLQRRLSFRIQRDLEQEFEVWFPAVAGYEDIRFYFDQLICDLFMDLEKADSASQTTMHKIDAYIKDNLDKMISLKNTCECIHLSQPYLSKLIRMYKNMSFNEYVTSLRIKKAKELFEKEPQLLAKEVSLIVGYEDTHYFSKVFKQITGVSPTDYKSRYTDHP